MAINKRKVLDNARKLAQKGAKQKALKEYNQLVQADPRDTKLLLEIGDVYRRWGQAEEAIAQYTRVANQYKQDGFDARAVAVLKQILNLDPKRYTSHVALAELYQRMGLDSDAIGALQTAADGYYREGRRREALELLRKMASLDPANTTSRLKVADLLRQEGMEDDAVAEYEEVVRELKRQGAGENICVVQERILELRGEHVPTLVALARNLSDLGRPERAERFAVRALALAKEPDHFELLAGIYKSLGNDVRLSAVTRELATFYKTRGDDDRAREVLQRLPPEAMTPLPGPARGRDRSESDESEVGEDELLEDEDFLVADASEQSDLIDLDEGTTVLTDVAVSGGSKQTELPDGDPEQLLAEASVYLRYGKRVQAIASLKSALRQRPEHRGILEKLGEAYAEDGQDDDAIGCWQRGAELARKAGDAEAFTILRDRIGALDPVAAGEIDPMDAEGGGSGEVGSAFEADLSDGDVSTAGGTSSSVDEFELSIEVSETDSSEPTGDSRTLALDGTGDDDGIGFDLDLDISSPRVEGAGAAIESTTEGLSIDVDTEVEVDIELDAEARDLFGESSSGSGDDRGIDFGVASDGAVAESKTTGSGSRSTSSQFGQSTTTAAQVKEDLEEAEFYIQQGLASEAEAIYRRVLAAAPNHPTALLKLGELAAERGEDPGSVSDPGLGAVISSSENQFVGGTNEISFDDDSEGGALPERSDTPTDASDGIEFELDLDDAESGAEDDTAEISSNGVAGAGPSEDLQAILAEAEAELGDVDGESLDASTPTLSDGRNELIGDDTQNQFAIGDDEAAADAGVFGEDATEVEEPSHPGRDAKGRRFSTEPVQAEPDPDDVQVDDTLPISDPASDGWGRARSEDSPSTGGGAEATFDLAAELADVFGDEQTVAGGASVAARSTIDDGFESLFSDFKKGVSAALDEGDYDTRFDLGIAYREMGLFNDALGEFTTCLGSPGRKLECLHMMALCSMELGRNRDAINHIEQALSSGAIAVAQRTALQFDLGRVQLRAGDLPSARHAFTAVQDADPSFPGLAAEWMALDAAGGEGEGDAGLEVALPREDYESFDDILGDDVGERESESEPETFESFDDVITDAEASELPAAQWPEPLPEPASQSQPASETQSDPGTSRPGRRKKKISFV